MTKKSKDTIKIITSKPELSPSEELQQIKEEIESEL